MDLLRWAAAYAEKITEKSPMGLNSEEGFTEVDENGDVAN
jgi:hypothetical protein